MARLGGKVAAKTGWRMQPGADAWAFDKVPTGRHTLIMAVSERSVLQEQQRQKLSLLA
jgi:hypothetical protein